MPHVLVCHDGDCAVGELEPYWTAGGGGGGGGGSAARVVSAEVRKP